MAFTKLTETPKKKVNFLKPGQVPDVIWDRDNEESEIDYSETVDDEEDCEQLGPNQSLLQS
jgi:hypothetical protein